MRKSRCFAMPRFALSISWSNRAIIGPTNGSVDLTDKVAEDATSSAKPLEVTKDEVDDWRKPLTDYLEIPSIKVDRKV